MAPGGGTMREVSVAGAAYLALATELLQRIRLDDPRAGIWEAADVQWWWRTSRPSDVVSHPFWVDDDGPVAGVLLTDWGSRWQCDALARARSPVPLETVWERAVAEIRALRLDVVEVLARDDDAELRRLLVSNGFVADDDRSGDAWMDAGDRPTVAPTPGGFTLVDRTQRRGSPHPMRRRSGRAVEARLRECSLYDPELDLAIETDAGDVAGYALFWLDRVTGIGLVEPMRVEDAYQRRGLARALLTAGVDRLAARGARRLKVGYGTEEARALYVGAGFRPSATLISYRWESGAKR